MKVKRMHTLKKCIKTCVKLEKDKIDTNLALRSIFNICYNSFWGKLANKSNKPQTAFVSSTEAIAQIINNMWCYKLSHCE
jgi:hypothetical protein